MSSFDYQVFNPLAEYFAQIPETDSYQILK